MKFFKRLVIVLVALVLVVGLFYFATNESKPAFKKETAQEADELAHKMLKSINFEAWENTPFVQWSFKEMHHYVWDKFNNNIQVKWKTYDVRLNLDDRNQFIVFESGNKLLDLKIAKELSVTAWEYFCNDSFWLNAPAKAFDEGTKRSIVIEGGKKGLFVVYESGGSTPGDAYLWFLDGNFKPYKYKMWSSIIPIGGVEATWEDWDTTATEALIATKHEMAILKILIKNLKTANSLEDLKLENDLFSFN